MSNQCFYVNIYRLRPSESEIKVSLGLTCGEFNHSIHFSREENCGLWFQRTCNLESTIFEDDNDRFVCKGSDVVGWFKEVTNVTFSPTARTSDSEDLKSDTGSFSLTNANDDKHVMHCYFDNEDEKNAYIDKYMKFYRKKETSQ